MPSAGGWLLTRAGCPAPVTAVRASRAALVDGGQGECGGGAEQLRQDRILPPAARPWHNNDQLINLAVFWKVIASNWRGGFAPKARLSRRRNDRGASCASINLPVRPWTHRIARRPTSWRLIPNRDGACSATTLWCLRTLARCFPVPQRPAAPACPPEGDRHGPAAPARDSLCRRSGYPTRYPAIAA